MGLVRIMRDTLTHTPGNQYADDLKVTIILVAKVLSCSVFLQGSSARIDRKVKSGLIPTRAKHKQTEELMLRSPLKEGIQHVF